MSTITLGTIAGTPVKTYIHRNNINEIMINKF